jgi:hypothetical protein
MSPAVAALFMDHPAGASTSYANPNGTGNRLSTMAIWTIGRFSTGNAGLDLIDGSLTGVAFFDIAGAPGGILFDFGSAKIIDAFKWYQDSANSQGTWSFRGGNALAGGCGIRTSIITVTTDAAITGNINHLVNGNLVSTGALYVGDTFFTNNTDAGKNITFDFGASSSPVIAGYVWMQGGAGGHGTWSFQGSPNNSTWTNLSTGINLGGTVPTIVTFANSTGYRYYRLLQTAGTTNNGPFIEQIMFNMPSVAGVDLATGINLGSVATQEVTFSNTTAYRYYELFKTSGSLSTVPYTIEAEFRISP